MEQNKDQGGAVASGKPQFPWNPDPINHEWTQPEIAAIHAFGEGCYQAGIASVQIGADVRGEAVAESGRALKEYALDEYQPGQWWLTELENHASHRVTSDDTRRAAGIALDFAAKVFSARAADAPSEPSDDEIVAIARQAIRDGSATWDHFQKDDAGKFTVPVLDPKDFMLVRAVLAAVKSRAADALDSQPTEPTGYVRISELKKLESNRVAGVGMMVQKEGGDGWTPIYASSQPTDGGVRK